MVTKKQRQRQLAREKWLRQETRRLERRHSMRRRGIIVGAVVAVLLAAAGISLVVWLTNGPDDGAQAADDPGQDAADEPAEPECFYLELESTDQAGDGDEPAPVGLPQPQPDPGATAPDVPASLVTDAGELELELDGENAPCAVNSLAFLAEQHTLDGVECDRLTVEPAEARYLECGAPEDTGYFYAAENVQSEVPAGSLVLATEVDANDGRFRVTYADSVFDEPVTVVGRVTGGIEIVEQIAADGLADTGDADGEGDEEDDEDDSDNGDDVGEGVGRPKEPVVIESLNVTTNAS